MPTLAALAADPAVRPRILDDCAAVLDREVAAKRGLVAFALRQAYHGVRRLEHGQLIRNVFDKLLDEFAAAVDPFVLAWQEHGPARGRFADYLVTHRVAVAAALLVVTDRERDRVGNRVLVAAYNSLRGTAAALVQSSVPALADMLDRWVDP